MLSFDAIHASFLLCVFKSLSSCFQTYSEDRGSLCCVWSLVNLSILTASRSRYHDTLLKRFDAFSMVNSVLRKGTISGLARSRRPHANALPIVRGALDNGPHRSCYMEIRLVISCRDWSRSHAQLTVFSR
ncbi:hypothetical protein DFH06DRAFT_1174358 [Mycena polygramma]|nr:hypothetical protein DFH06DRAFT_1234661 [Mycena polygramma]KAJ7673086.1 hypothetical protein DFH06DRAFT_1174358 [Mycena polygramma]